MRQDSALPDSAALPPWLCLLHASCFCLYVSAVMRRIDYFVAAPSTASTARPITLSTSQKYAAKMKTVTITTAVVDCTSAREGQTTLRISLRTSLRKLLMRSGSDFSCCIPALVCCSATATVLAIMPPQIFSYCWLLLL